MWLEFAGFALEVGLLGYGARAALHGVTHIDPGSAQVRWVPGNGRHGI